MCINGNNAIHANHYINSQLISLWENARACVEHYDDAIHLEGSHQHSIALRQFSISKREKVSSKDDLSFFASFGKPKLEFACNHEVILYLSLEDVHFDLRSHKGASFSSHRARRVNFEDVEVAFRLPFTNTGIRGSDHQIGIHEHVIKMVVLDFAKARLVSSTNIPDIAQDSLFFHLRQYFDVLVRASHHILFSLPEIDDPHHRLKIDYSSTVTDLKWDIQELHGISVEKINDFLASVWLKAAWLAGSKRGLPKDRSTICVSEYRSSWSTFSDSDLHFHLKFDAPQIKALCGSEAVVFFSIDEVLFSDIPEFSNSDAKFQFNNWQIALVVDVVHQTHAEGSITALQVDWTSARFSQDLSIFFGFDEEEDFVLQYVNRLIRFFSFEYTQLLAIAQFHALYYHDIRISATYDYSCTDSDEEWHDEDGVDRGDIWWKKLTSKTNMFDFHEITTISQESIDEHFLALLSIHSNLKKWSYNSFFSTTVNSITVRFLSDERAIVWVDLESVRFKTLRDWFPWAESDDHEVSGWKLAFQVDLKMATRRDPEVELVDAFLALFEDSIAYKYDLEYDQTVLRQIYLDLRHATFVQELSTFGSLTYGRSRAGFDKIQAVIYYIKDHYLHHLADSGHHVLYSVPFWRGDDPPKHAITDIDFHIYSKEQIELGTWSRLRKRHQPVIVILAMTGGDLLPSRRLKYTTNWLMRGSSGIPYGTVSLSRKLFLEGHLLPALARINAATTVVPIHVGVEADGDWDLSLTSWDDFRSRKGDPPPWKVLEPTANELGFEWKYLDEWTHKHGVSNDEPTNGTQFVSLRTRNRLSIPTGFKNGQLDIIFHGETSLKIVYEGENGKSSAKASAKWSATISVISTSLGLNLQIGSSATPSFQETHVEGEYYTAHHKDPQARLEVVLSNLKDEKIIETLSGLKGLLEGIWDQCFPGMHAYALANPVFTTKGDLLLELRPHGVWGPHGAPRNRNIPNGGLARAPSYIVRSPSSSKPVNGHKPVNGVKAHAINGINGKASNGRPYIDPKDDVKVVSPRKLNLIDAGPRGLVLADDEEVEVVSPRKLNVIDAGRRGLILADDEEDEVIDAGRRGIILTEDEAVKAVSI